MKKIISIMLALSVLLLLAACAHSHAAVGGWEMDARQHWKLCECGEKCEVGEHTLDDMSVCTGCGAEVFVWDDGADISVYDDHGNMIHSVSFDAQGNVAADIRIEYTYDDQGNIRSEMRYIDDYLAQESTYENGILTTDISYFEDGTYSISLYDEVDLRSVVYYDADGTILGEDYSEYAYDADGNHYEVRSTTIDADGSKYVGEFNELGDQIAWITYDPEGNINHNERYEITYTEEGNKDTVKTYSYDVLVEEKIYTMVTFENGWMNYPGTIITYHEDGTKTVSEYDENDELISEVTYDADGNVIE